MGKKNSIKGHLFLNLLSVPKFEFCHTVVCNLYYGNINYYLDILGAKITFFLKEKFKLWTFIEIYFLTHKVSFAAVWTAIFVKKAIWERRTKVVVLGICKQELMRDIMH